MARVVRFDAAATVASQQSRLRRTYLLGTNHRNEEALEHWRTYVQDACEEELASAIGEKRRCMDSVDIRDGAFARSYLEGIWQQLALVDAVMHCALARAYHVGIGGVGPDAAKAAYWCSTAPLRMSMASPKQ